MVEVYNSHFVPCIVRERELPVIVVSAKSLTFNKVELLRLGADDYLTKPFDLDELLARIERNLLRSQKDTPNLCLTFGELRFSALMELNPK